MIPREITIQIRDTTDLMEDEMAFQIQIVANHADEWPLREATVTALLHWDHGKPSLIHRAIGETVASSIQVDHHHLTDPEETLVDVAEVEDAVAVVLRGNTPHSKTHKLHRKIGLCFALTIIII